MASWWSGSQSDVGLCVAYAINVATLLPMSVAALFKCFKVEQG